jgi:hypothetical protein
MKGKSNGERECWDRRNLHVKNYTFYTFLAIFKNKTIFLQQKMSQNQLGEKQILATRTMSNNFTVSRGQQLGQLQQPFRVVFSLQSCRRAHRFCCCSLPPPRRCSSSSSFWSSSLTPAVLLSSTSKWPPALASARCQPAPTSVLSSRTVPKRVQSKSLSAAGASPSSWPFSTCSSDNLTEEKARGSSTESREWSTCTYRRLAGKELRQR